MSRYGSQPFYECANCSEQFTLDELQPIHRYWERVEQGESEPAGECPDCGALCYEAEV